MLMKLARRNPSRFTIKQYRILFAALLALGFTGLAGCLPLPSTNIPFPTDTPPPPTASPTPTFVWFPPTVTPTRLSPKGRQVTPTIDPLPSHGAILLSDAFTDSAQWNAGKQPEGRATLDQDELSLVVTQPKGYLYSLLDGSSLSDFYLEVTASPTICRGRDEYGVLLRVASTQDFLRFALLCNGQARLDRSLGGKASSPVPPAPSGAVPPGAPSESRLGVWASGEELRFFANGQFLFSLHDSSLSKGTIGLFARAAGEESVTVNFSDLIVYALTP
jgi:hypothetical protein